MDVVVILQRVGAEAKGQRREHSRVSLAVRASHEAHGSRRVRGGLWAPCVAMILRTLCFLQFL